ncbi:MAG: hypothetical protein WAK89_19750 [Candidatus Sulfotelmatobacter sp.]
MHDDAITISPGPRFRTAMILAVIADALQIIVFPAFIEGAISPADDLLDLGIGAAMINLLGWHWEFLPSFLGKLVPGVDLVPVWTLAAQTSIANQSAWQRPRQKVIRSAPNWKTRNVPDVTRDCCPPAFSS